MTTDIKYTSMCSGRRGVSLNRYYLSDCLFSNTGAEMWH